MANLESIDIFYHGHFVGRLSDPYLAGRPLFAYSDSFIDTGIELSPFLMPLSKKLYEFPKLSVKTFRKLPPLCCDSFPDSFGSKLYNRFLNAKGIKSANHLFYLSYLGNRGAGALEYRPAVENTNGQRNNDPVDFGYYAELIQFIQENKYSLNISVEDREGIIDLSKLGGSAGGARPKIYVASNNQDLPKRNLVAGDITYSGDYTYSILKISDPKIRDAEEDYGKMEYVYYRMARDCGIPMMESELIDGKHFSTKRFDRDNQGNKFHYQTFNSLFGLAFDDESLNIGYEHFLKALKRFNLPQEDITQLYKQMCFNVIALNRDDHTKNFSLIMNEDNKWRLAPAYDLCYCENPYHTTTINGKDDEISAQDLLDIGRDFMVKGYDDIIGQIKEVVSNFRNYTKDLDFRKQNSIVDGIEQDIFSKPIMS
jgi:serine/threonine-protein kinase HipA